MSEQASRLLEELWDSIRNKDGANIDRLLQDSDIMFTGYSGKLGRKNDLSIPCLVATGDEDFIMQYLPKLIAKGANINSSHASPYYDMPAQNGLNIAIEMGLNCVAKLLIDEGVQLSYEMGNPLCRAIDKQNSELIHYLVNNDADINWMMLEKRSEHIQPSEVEKEIFDYLYRHYLNKHDLSSPRVVQEQLFIALQLHNPQALDILHQRTGGQLKHSIADFIMDDPHDYFEMFITDKTVNAYELVKTMVEVGFPIEGYGTSTPLVAAMKYRKYDIAQYLLDNGANVNVVNEMGASPLIMAAFCGNIHMVNQLLAKGCDCTIANRKFHMTALMMAVAYEHVEVVKTLLEHETDINRVNRHGESVLHIALKKNKSPQCLEMILQKQPSLTMGHEGLNIHQLAKKYNPDMLSLLGEAPAARPKVKR